MQNSDESAESTGTSPGATQPVRLRMTGIQKSFGATQALAGVDFELRRGEVHALVGENGAGKSTLMNIMSGVITDYRGTMELDGEQVRFASPHAAQQRGISTVFQELDLVHGLSIADNLGLGKEPKKFLWVVDAGAVRERAQAALSRIGSSVSPRTLVGQLRLGEQQVVMIAKALAAEAKVLILDEPTAALNNTEVDRLFDLVREVTSHGVAVVFISHRLEEIPQIADRVTVMREGRIVSTLPPDAPQQVLVHHLTGRSEEELFPAKSAGRAPLRLRLQDLTLTPRTENPGWQPPQGISLDVRQGEIVGIVGLMGAGRTELLQTLAGAAPEGRLTGTVEIDGKPVNVRSVASALGAGIAYVPDDRRGGGFVAQRDIAENLTSASLSDFSRFGFLSFAKLTKAVRQAIVMFGIKTSSPRANILSLSGGNQQKVVFGRALMTEPTVLLLDEPTRGVDIGAKADIYRLIREHTKRGVAVLIASSELPEVLGLCDRIVVMRRGRFIATPPIDTPTQELIEMAQVDTEEALVP
ncbi:MAG: sugar ABC transporter ATP-binding protein [Micropruina sp.]|nr:MAG: sugar ABC transporter ATP-binding protein [Micropruina sp.]